jgi:hypothetical protein
MWLEVSGTQPPEFHAVAITDPRGRLADARVGRAPYRKRAEGAHQVGHAADVVGMMVGQQDAGEGQPAGLQRREHRSRFSGIDHDRAGARADAPNVVILERIDRVDRDAVGQDVRQGRARGGRCGHGRGSRLKGWFVSNARRRR